MPEGPPDDRFVYLSDVLPTAWQAVEYANVPQGGSVLVLGLGPIGVDPDRQGDGIGSALMHAVLGAADALGDAIVALLGNPAYYGRFGFAPSRTYDITPPNAAWGDYFQVRTLTAYRPELHGTFHYAAPFDAIPEE